MHDVRTDVEEVAPPTQIRDSSSIHQMAYLLTGNGILFDRVNDATPKMSDLRVIMKSQQGYARVTVK